MELVVGGEVVLLGSQVVHGIPGLLACLVARGTDQPKLSIQVQSHLSILCCKQYI